MDIRYVYFDMDSVLADFERGVIELCGLQPNPAQGANKAKDDEMWEEIKNVDRFYYKLELMPGAKEMFDMVYEKYGNNCRILTAVPKPHRGIVTAKTDKEEWVRKKLSEKVEVITVLKEEKKKYVTGPDSLLIDDMQLNVEAWRSCGGTVILHKDSETTIKELRRLGVI